MMKSHPVTRALGASIAVAGMVALASPAAAQTAVDPTPPVFTDACNTDSDTYLIPMTEGVDYYVGGVKMASGIRAVDPSSPYIEVFTRAQPGYTLSSSATWSHTFDAERGCDGQTYVKTGNAEPAVVAPVPTAAPEVVVEVQPTTVVEPAPQVVMQPTDDELPRTGFDPSTAAALALVSLAALGGWVFYTRREPRGGHQV